MRFLVQAPPMARHYSIGIGWANALSSMGHQAVLWRPELTPAFDAFDAACPRHFVETRPRSRAVERCLAAHPGVSVIPLADPMPAFDDVRFAPGTPRPGFATDFVFVGDNRPGKAALLESYLRPFLESGARIRLHGPTPFDTPRYAGPVDGRSLPDIYASAKVCLNISGGRMSERAYQAMGLGAPLVTNVPISGPAKAPDEFFREACHLLAAEDDERGESAAMNACFVRGLHTYKARVSESLGV